MSTSQTVVMVVLLFLGGGIFPLLVLLAYISASRDKELKAHAGKLEAQHQQHEQEVKRLTDQQALNVTALNREINELRKQNHHARQVEAKLTEALSKAKESIDAEYRRLWFEDIQKTPIRSKPEIEIRICYPLLKFLGYRDNDIVIQKQINFQFNGNVSSAFLDFLTYKPAVKVYPFLLIYVALPSDVFDESLTDRVRSYAHKVNCAKYLITDGRRFLVYERLIPADLQLCDTLLDVLVYDWEKTVQMLGSPTSIP